MDEKTKALLSACALFDGLTDGEKQALIADARFERRRYRKGERIGYDGGALGMLAAGRMRVGGRKDEHRAIINEMRRGALFGFASLGQERTGGKPFVSDIWAVADTTVLWLPEKELGGIIARAPAVALNLVAMQSEKIRFLNERIRGFTAPDAARRLYAFLARLEKTPDGSIVLPMGMAPLAKRLGISRASLYRAFEKLRGEGILEKTGAGVYCFKEEPTDLKGEQS